ncbi:hypothetical protein FACS1894191_7470 [Clostridia bacterium]|nr:hypothetical protein FACS1894191_7470 [Clostridia bacterium]
MEAVRQIIDGNLLNSVIPLPESFRNMKVEVTIKPASEENSLPFTTRAQLRAMLSGSVTQSISGALPYTDMTPEDFRNERLRKYERAD